MSKNRHPNALTQTSGAQPTKSLAAKVASAFLLLCTIGAGLTLGGCGSSGGGSDSAGSPAATSAVVSGVAATGAPISGAVYLKDSSAPSVEKTTFTAADGSFSFDVTGLTPPFILKAQGTSGGTSATLCSFAAEAGTANINPLSNAAIANAANVSDPTTVYAAPTPTDLQTIAANLPGAVSTLMTKLKPLLDQYSGANVDPITAPFAANHTGLDAVFDAVTIQVGAGTIIVANRQNNAPIFSAPLHNLAGGQMNMANMPTAPQQQPSHNGAALYASNCQPCHGSLTSSSMRGTSAGLTKSAISGNAGGMGFLSALTDAEIQAIVDALAVTPNPTPIPTPTPPPTVDPGKTVYDARCASCHRLGTYDAAGSAPNLSGGGSKVSGKYTAGVSGHKGITLTATDISNLKTFFNAN